MNINTIRQFVRAKYKRHWEWRSTTTAGSGKHYVLIIWTGLDRKDLTNIIKIYATLSGSFWTSNVSYLDCSGPVSEANLSRELAVEEALNLWWEDKKVT